MFLLFTAIVRYSEEIPDISFYIPDITIFLPYKGLVIRIE